MGQELEALKRVVRAIPMAARDGLIEAAKTSPQAKFGLVFLQKLHDACRKAPQADLAAATVEVQGSFTIGDTGTEPRGPRR